jgi:hypothetical protein
LKKADQRELVLVLLYPKAVRDNVILTPTFRWDSHPSSLRLLVVSR